MEEGLASVNLAIRIDLEARVAPRPQELQPLLGDLLALEHHVEGALAEEFFEWGKVDVGGKGVESLRVGDRLDLRGRARISSQEGVGISFPDVPIFGRDD